MKWISRYGLEIVAQMTEIWKQAAGEMLWIILENINRDGTMGFRLHADIGIILMVYIASLVFLYQILYFVFVRFTLNSCFMRCFSYDFHHSINIDFGYGWDSVILKFT